MGHQHTWIPKAKIIVRSLALIKMPMMKEKESHYLQNNNNIIQILVPILRFLFLSIFKIYNNLNNYIRMASRQNKISKLR